VLVCIWIFWYTLRDGWALLIAEANLLPDGELLTPAFTPHGTNQPIRPLLNSLFWMMPPLYRESIGLLKH
jgi:hypothetical protein